MVWLLQAKLPPNGSDHQTGQFAAFDGREAVADVDAVMTAFADRSIDTLVQLQSPRLLPKQTEQLFSFHRLPILLAVLAADQKAGP
jgi:hypothetical protein